MDDLIFVTGSRGKLLEAERILGRPIIQKELDLPEIQSLNVEEVVEKQAKAAYKSAGVIPVIVEDTGLYIDSWQGLPGALIRWFLETVGPKGICRMLDNFPHRAAIAKSIVAKYDGSLRLYAGEVKGTISAVPRGENGFGWDAIFIPEGDTRTFAEMSPEEKDRFSMRKIAFQKLAEADSTARLSKRGRACNRLPWSDSDTDS